MTTAPITDGRQQQQADFLLHLRGTGLVSHAAGVVSVTRRTLYLWRQSDPAFATAWDEALEDARKRISAALREAAIDKPAATAMLDQVAERLKNPDLSAEDRATHQEHLRALGERIEELRALATSEAAKAHVRRRDEARGQLRDDAKTAVFVAAEFDDVVKELDPHWKRLLAALEAMRQRAVRAEVDCPEVSFSTMVNCAFYHHCPQFAEFIGLSRPHNRHQQEFSRFVSQRVPAEVRP